MIAYNEMQASGEADRSKKKGECLNLEISLGGKNEAALIDTGAQASAIAEGKLTQLKQPLDVSEMPRMPEEPFKGEKWVQTLQAKPKDAEGKPEGGGEWTDTDAESTHRPGKSGGQRASRSFKGQAGEKSTHDEVSFREQLVV